MTISERLGGGSAKGKLYSSSSNLGQVGSTEGDAEGENELKTLRNQVVQQLAIQFGSLMNDSRQSRRDLENKVVEAVAFVIDNGNHALPKINRADLVQGLVDDLIGNGPIEPFLRDPSVTEIMVNRFNQVFIERDGKIFPAGIEFHDEEHLRSTIERIVSRVGRRIDESSPMVDARLPDGSRVNAVIAPIALDGSSLTIRKFANEALSIQDLIANETITEEAAKFLESCIQGKLNVVISGGTGSGKTTTLNVMASFIPPSERIITIEDSAELQLNKPHVIRLESRPLNVEGRGLVSIRDLVRNSLRMRPDRIVIGEVRDGTAFDMLQAMNTGHDGSMTTVHANTPTDALTRIESMSLMAGMEIPLQVIREQISQSINLVLQQSRLADGSRKITSILEIDGFKNGELHHKEIFRFNFGNRNENGSTGKLEFTGTKSGAGSKIRSRGVACDENYFEFNSHG